MSDQTMVLKCMGEVPSITLPIVVCYKSALPKVNFTMDSTPTDGSQNPISSDGVYEALNGGRYY